MIGLFAHSNHKLRDHGSYFLQKLLQKLLQKVETGSTFRAVKKMKNSSQSHGDVECEKNLQLFFHETSFMRNY